MSHHFKSAEMSRHLCLLIWGVWLFRYSGLILAKGFRSNVEIPPPPERLASPKPNNDPSHGFCTRPGPHLSAGVGRVLEGLQPRTAAAAAGHAPGEIEDGEAEALPRPGAEAPRAAPRPVAVVPRHDARDVAGARAVRRVQNRHPRHVARVTVTHRHCKQGVQVVLKSTVCPALLLRQPRK